MVYFSGLRYPLTVVAVALSVDNTNYSAVFKQSDVTVRYCDILLMVTWSLS